jgi:hypothetical protein
MLKRVQQDARQGDEGTRPFGRICNSFDISADARHP